MAGALGSDPTTQALTSFASTMPVKNAANFANVQQARDLSLQSMAGQTTNALTSGQQPGIVNVNTLGQQGGASLASGSGQQQAKLAQQSVSLAGQTGQAGLQSQQQASTQDLAERKLALDTQKTDLSNRLADLSEDTKNKILDDNLSFKRDEAGRAYLNERQLADWAVTKAKSQEDLLNYQQQAQQAYKQKAALLDAARNKIMQQMQNDEKLREQGVTLSRDTQLAQAKADLDQQIAANERAQQQSASIWGAASTVVVAAGTVVASNPEILAALA